MNLAVCRILELDKILDVLARFTATPFGAEAARSLAPSSVMPVVQEALRETTEGQKLLQSGRRLPLEGTPDVRPHLKVLEVAYQSLPEGPLLELAALARIAQPAATVSRQPCRPQRPTGPRSSRP